MKRSQKMLQIAIEAKNKMKNNDLPTNSLATENLKMIMKIPTSPIGSGYYGHGDPGYELDYDVSSNDSEINFEEDDFSEYMWMENEEEFDKMEMQRLEEEALMEQCIEAMLQDELEAEEEAAKSECSQELCHVLSTLTVSSKVVEKSTLNPLAAEFVPSVYLVSA